MKFSTILVGIGLMMMSGPVRATDGDCEKVDSLVSGAATLMMNAEFDKARDNLETALGYCRDQTEILCNLTFAYSELGVVYDDEDIRKSHFQEAKKYAKKAYKADPESGCSNFAMAVALGREIEYVPINQKLRNIGLIKEYIDVAVEKDPDNHYAVFIQGQWHYQLAKLEGLLRFTAELVLGEELMKQADMDIAIARFQQATALWDNKIAYHLYLARAYNEIGELARSRQELYAVKELPKIFHRDGLNKEAAEELLRKLD